MAFTAEQLTALENAIALGALSIEYSDASGSHRTVYRNLEDMLKARELIRAALGQGVGNRTVIHTSYDRGLH